MSLFGTLLRRFGEYLRSTHGSMRHLKFGVLTLAGVVPAVAMSTAAATTYYIDKDAGQDSWTGTQSAPVSSPSADGPWQTLARVASANLSPGDEVRLRCGQVWHETLRIGQSGSLSAPIQIGSFPVSCTAKPVIDGSVNIPAQNWAIEKGSIYRARLPVTVLANGDLTQSIAGWSHWSVAGNASMRFVPVCVGNVVGCLELTAGTASWSLAISPNFAIERGMSYRVSFAIAASTSATLNAVVRRGGPGRYDTLGLDNSFTVGTMWQSQSFTFTASSSASNGRFDLHVPVPNMKVFLRNVRVELITAAPTHVFATDRQIQPAHHPNWPTTAASPAAIYLKNSVDSDSVVTTKGNGSNYVTTGSDLVLPAGGALAAGLTAHIRSSNWHLDRRRVTAVSGSRLMFDAPTRYRVLAGWGYFLTGAKWMLDAEDEWYHDPLSGYLSVWMPGGAAPGGSVSYGFLPKGIDLAGRSYVVVDGIDVKGVSTGVSINAATSIVLRNMTIGDTRDQGIDAKSSILCTIENSVFERTGLDAISGSDEWQYVAKNLIVRDNTIVDSAVQKVGNRIVSIPNPSEAAIGAGSAAIVSGNTIRSAAYNGIRVYGDSVIQRNSIVAACQVLDDCGGIYLNTHGNGTEISGNFVQSLPGNTAGTTIPVTRAVGIYLDDGARLVTVANNRIIDADFGIQVHDASENLVQNNTFFANRRYQLWFQEQYNGRRAAGDIFGNRISSNVFVSTKDTPAIHQESYIGEVTDFSTYDGNIYSALIHPKVILESSIGESVSYTFGEWRAAKVSGVSRNLDLTGRVVETAGFAPFRVIGGNMIPNGDLSNANWGWTWWNATAPLGTGVIESCTFGPCMKFTAGSTTSLISTPNFSTVAGRWYRVAFDAKTGAAGQPISVLARRGGGGTANYAALMPAPEIFTGNGQWTRYSFFFKASRTVTVDDPVTNERGARIDFVNVEPGRTLHVANVEMVPLSSVEASLRIDLISNPDTTQYFDAPCPVQATAPATCSQYLRFRTGTPVVWPYRLDPLAAEVVYARDASLLDTDRDGIPDSQDSCPGTAVGAAVRANGCAFGVLPP